MVPDQQPVKFLKSFGAIVLSENAKRKQLLKQQLMVKIVFMSMAGKFHHQFNSAVCFTAIMFNDVCETGIKKYNRGGRIGLLYCPVRESVKLLCMSLQRSAGLQFISLALLQRHSVWLPQVHRYQYLSAL